MLRVRIKNDLRFKWAILNEDGSPVDFTGSTRKLLVRKIDYECVQQHTVEGNVISFDFIASEQRYVGVYNLFLQYTLPDPTIEGGIATHTVDKCAAFELVPHSCELVDSPTDSIILEGIVSGLSYHMLDEEAKDEITRRLIDSGYLARINVVNELPSAGKPGEFYATFEK